MLTHTPFFAPCANVNFGTQDQESTSSVSAISGQINRTFPDQSVDLYQGSAKTGAELEREYQARRLLFAIQSSGLTVDQWLDADCETWNSISRMAGLRCSPSPLVQRCVQQLALEGK